MGRSICIFILVIQWTIVMTQPEVSRDTCSYYHEIIFTEKYYIYSPDYPNNYSAGTNCDWELKTAAGTKIYLSCDNVTLPVSPSCHEDRLLISLTGNKKYANSKKYCGLGSFSLISKGTALTIGLRGTDNSPGGQFFCTATAILSTNATLQSRLDPERVISNCDCGWRKMTRIVGGEESGIHEFPFMAALIYKKEIFCGANIISDRFALTAGHCVLRHNPSDHLLLVGDHNLNTGSDTNQSAIYKISAYEIYPEYDEKIQRNDIAILRTDTKIIFSQYIGPVCLPFRYTSYSFAGEDVVLLGWGQLEFTGKSAEALQKVHVAVIANQQCSSMQEEAITDGEICTHSTQGKDSCQTDSGGPLTWTDPSTSRYQLVGLISHGVGCGSASPAINTRVTEYLKWIVQRTGNIPLHKNKNGY